MALFNWFKSADTGVRSGGLRLSPEARTVVFWSLIIFFGFIFWISRGILTPFIWAIVTAYLFHSLVDFCEEKSRVHRVVWILLLYILVGGAVGWIAVIWWPQLVQELRDFVILPTSGGKTLAARLLDVSSLQMFGFTVDFRQILAEIQAFIRQGLPEKILPLAANLFEHAIHFLVYILATFYLLADADKYLKRGVKLIPQTYRREVVSLMSRINQTIGAYIRGLVVLIFIMSVLTFIALTILRVPYAVFLSLATGFLEVFPVVGPISAATLAILVVLQQPVVAYGLTHITMAMIVGGVYLVLRLLEDYLVIPNVVGRFVHVHPIVGIFALMVGAQYGGILGLFIAMPVAALLKVIVLYFYEKLVEETT